MRNTLCAAAFLAVSLFLSSAAVFARDTGGVISGNNQFAFDLYAEYKAKDGNIFFSPYSLSSALAMTYEGAKGKTADEMQAVLHFPKDDAARRAFWSGAAALPRSKGPAVRY